MRRNPFKCPNHGTTYNGGCVKCGNAMRAYITALQQDMLRKAEARVGTWQAYINWDKGRATSEENPT